MEAKDTRIGRMTIELDGAVEGLGVSHTFCIYGVVKLK